MAKGLRSSRNKANNRKLKANVFGPVENARKERMSAKLLEIALQPRPATDGDSKMEVEATVNGDKQPEANPAAQKKSQGEEMDIDPSDGVVQKRGAKGSHRIQKRGRQKAKSSMVFPVYKKGRRVVPRMKQRK